MVGSMVRAIGIASGLVANTALHCLATLANIVTIQEEGSCEPVPVPARFRISSFGGIGSQPLCQASMAQPANNRNSGVDFATPKYSQQGATMNSIPTIQQPNNSPDTCSTLLMIVAINPYLLKNTLTTFGNPMVNNYDPPRG